MYIRKQLLSYVLKYKGEYDLIKQAIESNEAWSEAECDENYITILDREYPERLLALDKPPFILFYQGDISLLYQPMMCVIGSRICSPLAHDYIHELLKYTDKAINVISGCAKGVDSLAHLKAIEEGRKTIGVVGNGLNISYPKENKKLYEQIKEKGLLLSEYPNDVPPYAHHFPMRNRIMAALCDECIVIEARKQSGTMITVGIALDCGKEIYVFPFGYYDLSGAGNNILIEMGANILKNRYDIQKIGKSLTKPLSLE